MTGSHCGARRERYPIFVRIQATTENADESVRLAQAVADAVIARHQQAFEDAIAPRLDGQRRIEARLKEADANRDLAIKLETQLDEVKANNSPPATRKTSLVEPAAPSGSSQPEVWRRVAGAALIAALVSIAVAAVVGHFKSGNT